MPYEDQTYETLLIEKKDHIAYLTLNRPEAINAVNRKMTEERSDFFTKVRSDNDVRVIIVTGAGEKGFCAGADTKEFGKAGGVGAERAPAKAELDRMRGPKFHSAIAEACEKPIIAGVHGYCVAGGVELCLVCDIVVATEDAKFCLREPAIAAFCAGGFTRMAEWLGKGRAKEVVLTAGWFSGADMYRMGLVNRLVKTKEELMPECEKIAKQIASNAPLSVWFAKKVINESYTLGHEQSLENEFRHGILIYAADDFQENIAAMREKRPPQFKGR